MGIGHGNSHILFLLREGRLLPFGGIGESELLLPFPLWRVGIMFGPTDFVLAASWLGSMIGEWYIGIRIGLVQRM